MYVIVGVAICCLAWVGVTIWAHRQVKKMLEKFQESSQEAIKVVMEELSDELQVPRTEDPGKSRGTLRRLK